MEYAWGNIKNSPISMKYALKLLTVLYGGLSMPIEPKIVAPII